MPIMLPANRTSLLRRDGTFSTIHLTATRFVLHGLRTFFCIFAYSLQLPPHPFVATGSSLIGGMTVRTSVGTSGDTGWTFVRTRGHAHHHSHPCHILRLPLWDAAAALPRAHLPPPLRFQHGLGLPRITTSMHSITLGNNTPHGCTWNAPHADSTCLFHTFCPQSPAF